MVAEGSRTVEREKHLIATGFSSLVDPYKCRHVPTGNPPLAKAVDLVPLDEHNLPTWQHIPPFTVIAQHMRAAEPQLEWGGSWTHFVDYPHFQLPYGAFP
jgi:peptidoglycan L-alanyl-D-glutamate endopeptidase CwlK